MTLKILIVEDNNHKRGRVISFLQEIFPAVILAEAHSFTAGCQQILEDVFDYILLDMSLPTYDKGISESGGRFRTFGGREIARKIIRRKINSKIIFITQYESFSERGLSQPLVELDEELRAECGGAYLGLIYYDSSKSEWKQKLLTALGSQGNESISS